MLLHNVSGFNNYSTKLSSLFVTTLGLLCFIVCLATEPAESKITERVRLDKDGYFVDSRGFRLKFHGFNSVLKAPPFYDEQARNVTRLKQFQTWGFNVVRLGVIWNAVMPVQGQFNTTYLDIIAEIIDKMSDAGIYVLIDMHQDVLSTKFGTYDAIPGWLLDQFPQPRWPFQFPWPKRQPPDAEDWFEGYLTYACQMAFQSIYDNRAFAWQHWGDYWSELARRFGKNPAVLGYELINEPFAGNFYTNPLRALPGYAGRKNLLPVYDYLVGRIRAHDNETLIFYEPVTWGVFMATGSSWTGTGFPRVPGSLADPSERNRSVLSYHYYCWILQTADPSTILPHWKKVVCDEILVKRVFAASETSVATTGGGRFLTEFGLCAPDNQTNSINTVECNLVTELADTHFQSWTYWDSLFFDAHGNPIQTQLRSFGRVYPRAVRGLPLTLRFSPATSGFYFRFIAEPLSNFNLNLGNSSGNDTDGQYVVAEIFLSTTIHFPNGKLHVNVEPETFTYERKEDMLFIKTPPNWNQYATVVVQVFA